MFFSRKFILIFGTIISVIIIALLIWIDSTIANIIAAVLGSIVASILVSMLYNQDLHNAQDKYLKIGLKNYFNNFEDSQDEIRNKIARAKKVDIYVMFADRFLNTSTNAFKGLISKENSKLRFFIYSTSNKFIDAYGKHWGDELNDTEYNAKGITSKIEGVKKFISILKKESSKSNIVELYEIKNAPISYSFYKIDNEIYFVPNKNIGIKYKPSVFHFVKTKDEGAMYSKIETELSTMISNNEFIKIEL
jgi:hypothetical protein